jgi:hypothetical protein
MTQVAAAIPVPIPLPQVDPGDPRLYGAGDVQVERTGWKSTLGFGGLALAGTGVLAGAASLVSAALSHGSSRISLPVMAVFGGAGLLGGAAFGLSRVLPPKTEHALKVGIPSEELAHVVLSRIPEDGRVVQAADGSFAILKHVVHYSSGGSSGGHSSSSGHSSSTTTHHSNPAPAPDYPSSSGGHTSPGDSGSSHSSGGNSTSNGNPSESDF